MIDRLDRAGLLPAITFIFSRAGCDAAVSAVPAAGLRLTTAGRARADPRRVVDGRAPAIPPEDLDVLGYWEWLRRRCERGIAAHHAGLLPAFKEIVEELFAAGLVKAVFATETLALGINMPARTVVLERLVKWNGETHADLTPGEYTQLTGRAGRRGIDVEGHAVVLWQPRPGPRGGRRAGLAPGPTRCGRASGPTYNMAVNLVDQVGRDRAPRAPRDLVRAVPGRPGRRRAGPAGAAQRRGAGRLRRGDGVPPRRLRRVRGAARGRSPSGRARCPAAMPASASPRPQQALRAAAARRRDPAARRASGRLGGRHRGRRSRARGLAPTVLTADRHVRRLTRQRPHPGDRPADPGAGARPRSTCRSPQARRDLASTLRNAARRGRPRPAGQAGQAARRSSRRHRAEPAAFPACARTPVTAAPSVRTTRAGPSAMPASPQEAATLTTPDRRPHLEHRAHLRPGLRAARRARVPGRRRR